MFERVSAKKKAKEVANILRKERPDYYYMLDLFRFIRQELDIKVQKLPKKLPYVPTTQQIKNYYELVWKSKNLRHMLIIKTLLYTGVRVGEFVNIRIDEVDFDKCQIRINNGKGGKDRVVPFPQQFREILAMHATNAKKDRATYLFESNWKKPYTTRGINKIMYDYAKDSGLERCLTPHKMRHFLFTWMKQQGIDDALLQPYSGHESRKSLEIYSKLSIKDAQKAYDEVIQEFPI